MRFNTAITAVRNSGVFTDRFIDQIVKDEQFEKEVTEYLNDVNSQTSRRAVVQAVSNLAVAYVDNTLIKNGTPKADPNSKKLKSSDVDAA